MILHRLVTMHDLKTALQHHSADWAAAVFTVPEQSEFSHLTFCNKQMHMNDFSVITIFVHST